MNKLQEEIVQSRPFASLAEEALLNLIRTADCLQRSMQRAIRVHGLTSTQYNVLRILRGAQPEGLTCSAIADRMIAADPDITRLLARLKTMGLIRQQRDKNDRRVVRTQIAPSGLGLLAELDPLVQEMPGELLGHLKAEEMQELIRMLESARQHCDDGQSRKNCEGKEGRISCEAADSAA